MMRRWKLIGLLLLPGAWPSLSGLAGPEGLPTCVHQETADGSLHWQCTGEQPMDKLVQTLTTFDKHLTVWSQN